ncbi:MAG: TolC family protein [Saprospiraceae bacterium]
MIKQNLTALLFLFLFSGMVIAQSQKDTLRLDVRNTIKLAVQNNPDLKRVSLNEDILQKQIAGAKSTAFPQVKINSGFKDNFALPQQLLPGEIFGLEGQIPVQFGTRYTLNAGAEVSQLLFSKEYIENIKKLDAAEKTYHLQTLSTMEDLIYQVASVYIQIQITKEQSQILKANLDRIVQLVEMAEAQFNNGIIKKLDVDQLKVNKTNLETELSNIQIGILQQKNLMKFYLALDKHSEILLTEDLINRKPEELSDSLLLNENLNYQILQQQQKITELDNDVIKAGYYPTLSTFFQYNYAGQGNELNFNEDNYYGFWSGVWGLNLSIPVFDGLQKQRKLEENKLRLLQIDQNKMQLKNASQLEFDNAGIKLNQNKKLINTQQDNMKLAQELYDVTKLSYQEGVAPLTELLNAETSLKQAQSQYLTALLNYKLAELEHIKVSGQLAKLIQNQSKK